MQSTLSTTECDSSKPCHMTWPRSFYNVILFLLSETAHVPSSCPPALLHQKPGCAHFFISKWIISSRDPFPTDWKAFSCLVRLNLVISRNKLFLQSPINGQTRWSILLSCDSVYVIKITGLNLFFSLISQGLVITCRIWRNAPRRSKSHCFPWGRIEFYMSKFCRGMLIQQSVRYSNSENSNLEESRFL